MNELITIGQSAINNQEVNTVNARDLHSFLAVGKDFSTWIKKQIERARLLKNRDYLVFTQKGGNLEGGRPTTEYHLTLEAGKHTAMLSGTEKGFEVREYFIECEQVARQEVDPMKTLNDPVAMRGLLLNYTEKVLEQQKEIKELTPKAKGFDRISLTDGVMNVTTTAKILNIRPKDLFTYLSTKSYIYRRVGAKEWVGYQHRVSQGILTHKAFTFFTPEGVEITRERVLVTSKGLTHLAEIFSSKPQQHVTGVTKRHSKQLTIQ